MFATERPVQVSFRCKQAESPGCGAFPGVDARSGLDDSTACRTDHVARRRSGHRGRDRGSGAPGRGAGAGAGAVRGDARPRHRAQADRARGADGRRGRAHRGRPARVPRRRRGRAVPGVGDAAVRAGVARDRDDGPPPPRDLAAARGRRATCRAAIVAPVRALVQRLGPHVEDVEPIVGQRRARSSTATSSSNGSSTLGYRREYQVEARGEVATRGSIVDVYPGDRRPSGAHRPVGRRGRPPLAVLGRRPAFDRATSPRRRSSPCASCCRPTKCAPAPRSSCRPNRGVASSGSGSRKGATFDGMESWLPWLTADEHLLPDLLAAERARRARRTAAAARPRPRSCSTRKPRSRRPSPPRGARRSTTRDTPAPVACRSTGCSRTPRRRPVAGARGARQSRHAGARGERVRSRRRRRRRRSRKRAQRAEGRRVTACSSRPRAPGPRPTHRADARRRGRGRRSHRR